MSLSLVRYVFLLLPLCTFTCSGVRGSLVVVVCPFFPTFRPKFCLFIIRSPSLTLTQSCKLRLRIGDSSTMGSDLGQIGGGSGRPTIIVD